MTSGHRALKYIEFCKTGQSAFNPAIQGVVLCESALDWVRQWYECQKQVRDHFIYDCNFPDMLGVINELKLAGNTKAELIVFSNDTRAPATNMERQGNTWNLIDKQELIAWCLSSSK